MKLSGGMKTVTFPRNCHVARIMQRIVEGGLLEDRKEYSVSDLERMYEIDHDDAENLHALLTQNA